MFSPINSKKSNGLFEDKFINCTNKFVINNFIIPDEKMPENPFDENSRVNILRLSLPNTVKDIKSRAFASYFNLNSLKYYASTDIPAYCFNNCNNLEFVIIDNKKCSTIQTGAFRKCIKLHSIDMYNIEHIEKDVFEYDANLKYIELPNTLIDIGNNAFKDSGIEFIIIPHSVKYLGKNIFKNCENLTEIKLSNYLYGKYINRETKSFDFNYLGLNPSEWEVKYKVLCKEFQLCKKTHKKESEIEYYI